jgi:phosphoribosyl-ATP pyrophosphohydrolase
MGYHKNKIEKGKLGEFSKIKEEFLEAQDAFEQDNKIMLLLELSDMLGAIEDFLKKYNINIDDLIKMKNATQSAFKDGTRK